jgi:protein-disulfide isomerase
MKYLYKLNMLSVLLLAALQSVSAQPGHRVQVNFKAFANQYVYLGYHFGNSKPISDSVKLNKAGMGFFAGKEKLKPGIYLLGYPNKKQYIELLIEKNQHFSVTGDTANTISGLVVKNSPEGIVFQGYQKFMERKAKEVMQVEARAKNTDPQVQQQVKADRKRINDEVTAYRDGIKKKYPGSLLPAIFDALKEPIVPDASLHPGGRYDSSYAWYFYKSNYWNGVSFSDERLLRTPVFEPRFDGYFKNIVYPSSDSIKIEADKILTGALKNREMFKLILSKLIDRYINPEFMGQDAVFIHLFEKYIAPGMADWLNEKQKKYVFDRAYSLMANLLGEKAAPLDLVDTLEKPAFLYNIKSNYTIVCFWDATCGHCKEVVPKLDSMYQNKWKNQDVTLYGVMTDGGKEGWIQYIKDNNLSGWTHVYQPEEQKKADYAAGRPNFRQLYDIVSTPKLFLLDKDKRILAKQLTWDQLDDLLQRRISGSK